MIKLNSVRACFAVLFVAGAVAFLPTPAHAVVIVPVSRLMHAHAHSPTFQGNIGQDVTPPDQVIGASVGTFTQSASATTPGIGSSGSSSIKTNIQADGTMLLQGSVFGTSYPFGAQAPGGDGFGDIVFELPQATTYRQEVWSTKSGSFPPQVNYTITESTLGNMNVPYVVDTTMNVTYNTYTLPAGHYTAHMSISGSGATGSQGGGFFSVFLGVVPEPSSATMLLIASVAGLSRRRRMASNACA